MVPCLKVWRVVIPLLMLSRIAIFYATSLNRIFTSDPLSTKTRLTIVLEICTLTMTMSSKGEGTSSRSRSENIKMFYSMDIDLLIKATVLGFLHAAFFSFLVFFKYFCLPYMQFTLGKVSTSKGRRSWTLQGACLGDRMPGWHFKTPINGFCCLSQCLFEVSRDGNEAYRIRMCHPHT